MSRSPHRLRGDAAEAWRLLLFGEVLRALEEAGLTQVNVRDAPTVKLPRSGRWQTGLSVLRPALDDDVLGHTALAVAWRWACAELEANAWPSVSLVAHKAVEIPIESRQQDALATGSDLLIDESPGAGRQWVLLLAQPSVLRVRAKADVDYAQVDRVAGIAAAWFGVKWRVAESASVLDPVRQRP